MKNSNCGNCPHIHRCYVTNDDECIDTIIGKKIIYQIGIDR